VGWVGRGAEQAGEGGGKGRAQVASAAAGSRAPHRSLSPGRPQPRPANIARGAWRTPPPLPRPPPASPAAGGCAAGRLPPRPAPPSRRAAPAASGAACVGRVGGVRAWGAAWGHSGSTAQRWWRCAAAPGAPAAPWRAPQRGGRLRCGHGGMADSLWRSRRGPRRERGLWRLERSARDLGWRVWGGGGRGNGCAGGASDAAGGRGAAVAAPAPPRGAGAGARARGREPGAPQAGRRPHRGRGQASARWGAGGAPRGRCSAR
jgi:hypothetical protein